MQADKENDKQEQHLQPGLDSNRTFQKHLLIDATNRNAFSELEDLLLILQKHNLLDLLNQPIDDKGNTLLHLACQKNHFESLELLLEFGANPNQANIQGLAPLHISSMLGNQFCVISLLNAKANVDITYCGFNAAYLAYQEEKIHILKLLVKAQSSVDKLLNLIISKQDYDTLIFILCNKENLCLDKGQKKELISQREAIWKSLQNYLTKNDSQNLSIKVYCQMLSQDHPLGAIFLDQGASSFWRGNKYIKMAKACCHELTGPLCMREKNAECDETTHLLATQYNSYK